MRHKHTDLIHAWAEGAEIQVKMAEGSDEWRDSPSPNWFPEMEYRIKPKKIKREGWINIGEFNKDSRYAGATIFDSKECALDNKPESWITTIKIEWEEEI